MGNATVILIMLTLTSTKFVTTIPLEFREGKYYETGTERVYNGYFQLKSESKGTIEAEGTLRDGLMHGLWLRYHANGNLMAKEVFEGGQKLRTLESWYYGGELRSLFDESAQVDTGYYRNGKIKSVTHYTGFSKNGDVTEWYENGNLKSEYIYYDYLEHGVCKEYYENGKLSLLSNIQQRQKERNMACLSTRWAPKI